MVIGVLFQKKVEILTGITLPYSTQIGEGLYIGHHSGIIVNANAVIGSNCNISQGVTIGVSGRGDQRGVPIIGNRVYIGVNAVIAGRITVGDAAVIAANSLVTRNVDSHTTVMGVPAVQVSDNDSRDYI
ncbi:hexapeptide transferase family protein [Nonlabens marinus S1-08]|uniref:Hexapeptide transferase family protein n=1 Tax=Nonlabens marinus S1-08 TaxID=1454201 RepID=W8VXD8_9FLAO|nr:hexapeptide transferase family protein [Nonlabens marinus S1-08]